MQQPKVQQLWDQNARRTAVAVRLPAPALHPAPGFAYFRDDKRAAVEDLVGGGGGVARQGYAAARASGGEDDDVTIGSGLQNLGNTCFANRFAVRALFVANLTYLLKPCDRPPPLLLSLLHSASSNSSSTLLPSRLLSNSIRTCPPSIHSSITALNPRSSCSYTRALEAAADGNLHKTLIVKQILFILLWCF